MGSVKGLCGGYLVVWIVISAAQFVLDLLYFVLLWSSISSRLFSYFWLNSVSVESASYYSTCTKHY